MPAAPWKDRVERLLREPNNLFGPPRGHGYDYVAAAILATALALAAGSVFCRLALETSPVLHPIAATLLRVGAAPAYIALWFLWPLHLFVGSVFAAVVWYATLHTLACLMRWRSSGKATRLALWATAILGWMAGLTIAFTFARYDGGPESHTLGPVPGAWSAHSYDR